MSIIIVQVVIYNWYKQSLLKALNLKMVNIEPVTIKKVHFEKVFYLLAYFNNMISGKPFQRMKLVVLVLFSIFQYKTIYKKKKKQKNGLKLILLKI